MDADEAREVKSREIGRLSGHEVRFTVFPEQKDQLADLRKAGGEVNFDFTSLSSAVPDTPTMTEAGATPPPGLDIREWYGVTVPAATPAPIIARPNAENALRHRLFTRP